MRCRLCKLCTIAVYSFRLLRVSFIFRPLFHFFVVLYRRILRSLSFITIFLGSANHTRSLQVHYILFALISLHSNQRQRKSKIFVPTVIVKHDTDLLRQRDIPHRSNCCETGPTSISSTTSRPPDHLKQPRCFAQVFLPGSKSSITTSTVLVVAVRNCGRSASQLWSNNRRLAV